MSNILFTDNFHRANGALGANWATIPGSSDFAISSNQAVGSIQANDSNAIVTAIAPGNDQWASVVVGTVGTTTLAGVGPVVRGTSSANTFYRVFTTGGSATMYLSKHVAGTITVLGTANVQVATNDVLLLQIIGTSLSVYKNGSLVLGPITDASIASGSPGMCYSSIDSVVDSIQSCSIGNFASNQQPLLLLGA